MKDICKNCRCWIWHRDDGERAPLLWRHEDGKILCRIPDKECAEPANGVALVWRER